MESYDFSEEEIREQLKKLGFHHVSHERLQLFKKDLAELVSHERSKSSGSLFSNDSNISSPETELASSDQGSSMWTSAPVTSDPDDSSRYELIPSVLDPATTIKKSVQPPCAGSPPCAGGPPQRGGCGRCLRATSGQAEGLQGHRKHFNTVVPANNEQCWIQEKVFIVPGCSLVKVLLYIDKLKSQIVSMAYVVPLQTLLTWMQLVAVATYISLNGVQFVNKLKADLVSGKWTAIFRSLMNELCSLQEDMKAMFIHARPRSAYSACAKQTNRPMLRPESAEPVYRLPEDYLGLKALIRPMSKEPHKQHIHKSDPVSQYQKYKNTWSNHRAPGDKAHKGLRWNVRENMLCQDRVVKKKQPTVYVPNQYTIPSDKKRKNLRWQIRNDLAQGQVPPSAFE
ncbi:hypothetical protein CAPTEDRAFT_222343 [Capitella teleta]|uniref:Centriolar and ciliogenesis-associated protein HYLS1 C-terminal domain-containing protein n=1 Tax=Capitella teleta TaxID=283909 RepID=R7U0H1_CAPTE|nr:hypothetical protein CAPTEDRAFT_222343 [Capitella teleta]|eukprot:ELT99499.1 hypothetical protein CAPTEDRAFT_222343 [Capitella teleta]